MNKLRMGVIGLRFGQWHVRTLAAMDQVDLVAIADRHPALPQGLPAYAAEYGAHAYDDGIAMINDESLDAVSLCVSPRAREPLIRAAAQRGIALFVEKPWASDLEQAQRLARLCEQEQAQVMLAFSFRFHPAIVRLRELLGHALGAPWLVNGSYVFSWLPPDEHWLWQPGNGNGFFNENSCHLFDGLNSLLGETATVSAVGASYGGCPSEDGAAITIAYKSGAVAALTCGGIGTSAYQDFPRLDVIASQGQARLQGRGHMWQELTWARRDAGPGALQTFCAPPETGARTRYTDALEHFAACVLKGETPSVGPRDGVRTVAMAMAVYQSLRTGQVVHLSDLMDEEKSR